MEKTIIEAQKREVIGKKVKVLRREGKLPAVIYGHGVEPTPIVLDFRASSRTLAKAEASTLITIQLGGEEYTTLVREKQWDYIRRELLHVDFQAVSMTEMIAAQVRIEFVGEAPAVGAGAVIVTGLNELSIEALPMDLPESIDVDMSVLENIGDGIFVRDIVVGDKMTILDDPDAMIIVASAPMAEEVEEVDALDEMLEGEEGEVAEGEEAADEGGDE